MAVVEQRMRFELVALFMREAMAEEVLNPELARHLWSEADRIARQAARPDEDAASTKLIEM